MKNWEYVETKEVLADCVEVLKKQTAISIDLEFDKNRYRYGFNLCLIQVYAGERCFIIDPLADGIDLKDFYAVIEDPSIEKVVYSFGEDLRLFHSLGCFPQNTFDIAIAMRLLDYPPASLGSAVYDILDMEISKSAQKSNWFLRPLSEKQLDYAAKDVLYLIEMQGILIKMAEEKGILEWIEEENKIIDGLSYADLDNNNYLKEKDKHGLSEHEYYVFKGLLEYRETVAEKHNRPSYQIIDKEYLRELSERPNQIYRFEKIRGVYKTLKNEKFKNELWETFQGLAKEAENKGLSKTEKALKRMSSELYQAKKKERSVRDEAKKKIFKPIQKVIAANHGENVVTYIMGNRLMDELALGKLDNLRNYKRVLIERYAAELDLDVSPYLTVKES
jgi:ribonuclease D